MRSDPYAELPQKTEKYANMATELHMGRKGISELWGLESFTNLHTLWLNDNELNSLEGLDRNIRLLHLHCHGNNITSILETLQHLKFLTNLTLNENQLTDIEEVISELRHLKNVQVLDLSDNPITQEDNYRLRMIAELPWLHILDKQAITNEERKKAKKVLKKIQRSKNILIKENNVIIDDPDDKSAPPPDVPQYIVDKMRKIVVDYRVFLEKELLAFDPQKKGVVKSDIFRQICSQYGLFQDLTEDDISVIIGRYTSHKGGKSSRRHNLSLSQSAQTVEVKTVHIDYPEFCRLVQPAQLRTMRFDDWKMEPVSELSHGAADLDRFVKTIKKKRADEAETLKRQSLLASTNSQFNACTMDLNSSAGTFNARSSTAPSSMSVHRTQSGLGATSEPITPQGIDSWLASTLRGIVKSIAANTGVALVPTGTGVPTIDGQQAIGEVLAQMKLHGKEPTVSAKAVRSNIQSMATPDGKIDINVFCDIVGCAHVVQMKNMQQSASSVTRKSSNRQIIPKIVWVSMESETQHHVEQEKFKESASYLDALLRAGKGTDTKELFATTMKAATIGTRLMSTRDLNPKPCPTYTPHQLIAAAPDVRADVVILPRLHKKKTPSRLPEVAPVGNVSTDVEAAWRKQFIELGLKKHELEFAVDRKKRSQNSKGTGVSSLSKSAANAFYGLRPTMEGEFITSNHKSSWNVWTGTLLLQKTG